MWMQYKYSNYVYNNMHREKWIVTFGENEDRQLYITNINLLHYRTYASDVCWKKCMR